MKKELKYIGKHMPKGMIIEVEENIAKDLVDREEFCYVHDNTMLGKVKESIKTPNMSWTEKEIKSWLIDNNINIDYNIKRDTKKEILEKIEAQL